MVKNKLQIILITYNRKKFLQRTFEQIFADNSPIKDFDITVLDNASTDGSSELIDEYCQNYINLKHIRHNINIGGNANICRAFEMGANSGKEYFWVLCDDDKYDFSNWSEVEHEIENKTDIICLADYVFKNQKARNNPAFQIFQLIFVPAGIYKSDLIDNNVLMCMYDAIYTMMQQACVSIKAVNYNKTIKCLSKPIVFNGLFFEDKCLDNSYTRGADKKEMLKRKKNNSWLLGYSGILTLLKNKKLMHQCMKIAVQNDDICGSWGNLAQFLYEKYFLKLKINYFIEIVSCLGFKRKLYVYLYGLFFIPSLIIYFYRNKNKFCVRILGMIRIKLFSLNKK